mgnify:CR=1 FL=1
MDKPTYEQLERQLVDKNAYWMEGLGLSMMSHHDPEQAREDILRIGYPDLTRQLAEAERQLDALIIAQTRAVGALVDAGDVDTDDLERGIHQLQAARGRAVEALKGYEWLLESSPVTSAVQMAAIHGARYSDEHVAQAAKVREQGKHALADWEAGEGGVVSDSLYTKYDPAEQDIVIAIFTKMLREVTKDGGKKRAAGTKPPWYLDKSHEAAIFSHLSNWKHGIWIDPDSGAHPLVHLAWRALAIAHQETYGKAEPSL